MGGKYYLLPEGDVSDTTLVKLEVTAGPIVRARIYYKTIASAAEKIGRQVCAALQSCLPNI